MTHTVSVKVAKSPSSFGKNKAAGWRVKCFRYLGIDDNEPQDFPLAFVDTGNDDTFVASVNLIGGIYGLHCEVTKGVELEVTLDEPESIFQPTGADWPVTAAPPPTQQRDIDSFYFTVGGA